MKQLEEKVKILSEENATLKQQKAKLIKQNKDQRKEYDIISQQYALLQEQLTKQQSLSSRKDLFKSDTDFVELSGQLTQFQNYSLYEQGKQIQTLNNQLNQKNNEISQLRALLQLSELQTTQSSNCYDDLRTQIIQQKTKNEILQKENDQLVCEKKAEGQFRIELEHVRAENQLYCQLLGFTPSVENLGDIEFHPESVQLKSIKNIKYPIKPTNQIFDYCRNCQKDLYMYRSCCNPLYNLSDNLLYVPGDAFNFAQQFKNKYLKEKNDLDIDQVLDILLFELNKIWLAREKNHLKLLASHCKRRISEIKRDKNQKPLSEKEMIQNIKRLKKQVKDLQQENLEMFQQKFEYPLI